MRFSLAQTRLLLLLSVSLNLFLLLLVLKDAVLFPLDSDLLSSASHHPRSSSSIDECRANHDRHDPTRESPNHHHDPTDGAGTDDAATNNNHREEPEQQLPSDLPFHTRAYGMARSRHKRSMLTTVQPQWYLQPGLGYLNDSEAMDMRSTIIVPPDTTRICIDIGTYISSPTSRKWWSLDDKTFVMAFEANYFSSTLLTRLAHPIFHEQGSGYWPVCAMHTNVSQGGFPRLVKDCMQTQVGHITEHFQRFLLLPLGLHYRDEFATFLVGFPGRPDGGSLLTFRPKLKKNKEPPGRIQIGIAPLAPFLRLLPAFVTPTPQKNATTGQLAKPLLFDTIKIDAQGVDELILEGGGRLLARFACVIAELDLRAYNAGRRFDYAGFMVAKLGFVRVGHSVFVNPRFKEQFARRELLCTTPDLKASHEEILRALG